MPDRCFVAMELPQRRVALLGRVQARLADDAPAWRTEKWVASELLHVTVAFLGAVPDAAFGGTLDALSEVVLNWPVPRMAFDGARAIPDRRHAQMIWATLATVPQDLSPLRDAVLSAAGLPSDARPFRPHVTLVRARRSRGVHGPAMDAVAALLSEAGKAPDGAMSVPSLTVFSSTLGPNGPTYRRLAQLPMSGGATTGTTD